MTAHAETTTAQRPDKRLATARARLALQGGQLYACDDDRSREVFVASLGGLTRQFADLSAVEAWLDRLEERTVARTR
jgi:hypothetical protein